MQKLYVKPVFELVRIDEKNRVFYSASVTVSGTTLHGAAITNGSW